MSSDAIKDALVAKFPGTKAKDWKRASKKKVGLAVHRTFDHPQHFHVLTVEDSDGNISIHEPALTRPVVRETKDGYDRFFVTKLHGEPWEYVFVDTDKTKFYPVLKENGYKRVVGFPVKTYRGEGNTSMPVILEDLTRNDGLEMDEISFKDIPPGIKQRYTRWKQFQ